MKHTVNLQINNKDVELCFSIGELAKLEKAIGQSLFSLMMTDIFKNLGIDFTLAGLAYGLTPNITLGEAADMVQEHCENGGTIDTISAGVLDAILATGLYTPNASDDVKKKTPARKTSK